MLDHAPTLQSTQYVDIHPQSNDRTRDTSDAVSDLFSPRLCLSNALHHRESPPRDECVRDSRSKVAGFRKHSEANGIQHVVDEHQHTQAERVMVPQVSNFIPHGARIGRTPQTR